MEPRNLAPDAPVLVAFDPRAGDRGPVEFAIAASAFIGAPLIVTAVFEGGHAVTRVAGDAEHREQGPAQALEHLKLDLERRGIAASIHPLESASVGVALTQAVDELAPQLMVMGATQRGKARTAVVGDTIGRVIQHARGPVAVVPHGYERPEAGIRTVGAAYAPTAEGAAALRVAAALARLGPARLRAIQVLDPKHAERQVNGLMAEQHNDVPYGENDAEVKRLHDRAALEQIVADLAPDLDAEVDTLLNDPADGLLAAARQVDLLVMGSRARGSRRAAILGSVSSQVAGHATCPVVIIPKGTGEAADELVFQAGARRGAAQ